MKLYADDLHEIQALLAALSGWDIDSHLRVGSFEIYGEENEPLGVIRYSTEDGNFSWDPAA